MTSCPCTIDNWIAAVWRDQGATARRSFHCLGSGVEVLPRWEADDGGASGPPGASTIENALLTSEWTDLVQLSVCTNTTAQSTVTLKDNFRDWEVHVLPATV